MHFILTLPVAGTVYLSLVYSFVELVSFLLSLNGAEFLLTEKFNQDSVESFFGKQRARCGRGDNPTVKQFSYNTQAIRTGRSMSFGKCKNIQQKRLFKDDVAELCEPLQKKKKSS